MSEREWKIAIVSFFLGETIGAILSHMFIALF